MGSFKGTKSVNIEYYDIRLGIKDSIVGDETQYYRLKNLGRVQLH